MAVLDDARYQARWGHYDVRAVPYLKFLLSTAEPLLAGYRARPLDDMGLPEVDLMALRFMREQNEEEVAGIRRRLTELGVDLDRDV